jgi:broad specificity phosphatase PhoE
VLVVTHAGAIAQVVGEAEGTSPARWETARPANCSVTTVECDDDGTIRVVEFDRRVVPGVTPVAGARQRAG